MHLSLHKESKERFVIRDSATHGHIIFRRYSKIEDALKCMAELMDEKFESTAENKVEDLKEELEAAEKQIESLKADVEALSSNESKLENKVSTLEHNNKNLEQLLREERRIHGSE